SEERVASPKLAVFILQILHELLMALCYLHNRPENKIIRCVLKPENILFGKTGIKISDFGLGNCEDTVIEPNIKVDTAFVPSIVGVGMPIYQTPEQVEGSYGSITNVCAIGLIMLELFYDTRD